MSTHSIYPTRDWLEQEQAARLAVSIRDYWAKQGKDVIVSLVTAGDPKSGKNKLLYCVRSDMVNGLPRVAP